MADVVYYSNLPAEYSPDGIRYRVEVTICAPTHLVDPTYEELPRGFIQKGMQRKLARDVMPLGVLKSADMDIPIDRQAIRGTPLHAAIVGRGIEIAPNVRVNTLWTVKHDDGNPALAWEDMPVWYQGAQVYDLQADFEPGSHKIQLASSQGLILSHITTGDLGNRVRDHIPELGGLLTSYGAVIRKRLYTSLYGNFPANFVYAWIEGDQKGEEEAVCVPYRALWTALGDLCREKYRLLVRNLDADWRFFATGDFVAGCPQDEMTMFTQSFDFGGLPGDELPTDDMYTNVFIRKTGTTELLGGALYPGNAAGDGKDGLCAEYKTALEWLAKLTEYSLTIGTYGIANEGDVNLYDASVLFMRTWAPSGVLSAASLPSRDRHLSWKVRRAGAATGGAKAVIAGCRQSDQPHHEYSAGGAAGNLNPYDLNCYFRTGPSVGDSGRWYVYTPNMESFGHAPIAAHHVDLTGSTNRVIVGTQGFSRANLYYLVPNAAHGGPAWITGSDDLMVRVHEHVEFNLGGWEGAYNESPLGSSLPIPTSFSYSDFPKDFDTRFFTPLRLQFILMQRRSWPAISARVIGKISSNPDHCLIEFEVRRPNPYQSAQLNDIEMDADFFEDDLAPYTATSAVMTVIETELGGGVDAVTVYVRGDDQ